MASKAGPAGRKPEADMKHARGRRLRCWRPVRGRDRGPGRRAAGTGGPPGQAAVGETVAAAMQLAIGLLTASLDSPGLETVALKALTPHDAAGLGNFMAAFPLVPTLS